MIIEKESRQQSETRQDIITGKKREPYRNETWFPVIPQCYYKFKEKEMYLLSTTIKKKGCKKKAELSLEDSVPSSKRITCSKTANAKARSVTNYFWYYSEVLFLVPLNSTSNSAETSSKNTIFLQGFGTI
jgi:hypothetical protein